MRYFAAMQAYNKFLKSALTVDGSLTSNIDAIDWIAQRNANIAVRVTQVSLDKLSKWYTEKETGNIRHDSHRFFSIEGARVKTNVGITQSWAQPIINQPEIGYLGFIVREINGVYHFLCQAKIEPGNVNCVQISPTIQATQSNFTRVHAGKSPMYLEYFQERKGRVLFDQLQSEQGARFFRKRNRNIIIEVDHAIDPHEDFKWLTLGQIKELLKIDNLVNMDTRTVISGINYGTQSADAVAMLNLFAPKVLSEFHCQLLNSYITPDTGVHEMDDLISWITNLKSIYQLQVNLIPLNDATQWKRNDFSIYHEEGKYFEVIGVEVSIENREVQSWCQPIVKPCQEGIVAFLAKKINGVLHFLVQAKLEIGNLDIIELAPTIQCITGNYRKGQNEYEVPFLDAALDASPKNVMYDVLLSEEGGRFYKNQNRNMVILMDENFDDGNHPNFRWMTLHQIMQFLKYNNYINIEARSLLSVLAFA